MSYGGWASASSIHSSMLVGNLLPSAVTAEFRVRPDHPSMQTAEIGSGGFVSRWDERKYLQTSSTSGAAPVSITWIQKEFHWNSFLTSQRHNISIRWNLQQQHRPVRSDGKIIESLLCSPSHHTHLVCERKNSGRGDIFFLFRFPRT